MRHAPADLVDGDHQPKNAAWLTQQVRNCAVVTNDNLPEAIIRDNDAIFGKWFDPLLREFGVTAIPIPYRAPWFNGYVERFHRSEKEEILYRVPVATADHAGRLCFDYTNFYNQLRPHQGIAGRTPTGQSSPTKHRAKSADLRVRKTKHAFGLITHFTLAA